MFLSGILAIVINIVVSIFLLLINYIWVGVVKLFYKTI